MMRTGRRVAWAAALALGAFVAAPPIGASAAEIGHTAAVQAPNPGAAGDPLLTVRLVLRGPVPANTAITFGGETSAAYVCLPASASATWPKGSIVVPSCQSGRTYTQRQLVPAGSSVVAFLAVGYCVDAACTAQHDGREIWRARFEMGSLNRTITITHRFPGAPATDAAPPGSALPATASDPGCTSVEALLLLSTGSVVARLALRRSRRRIPAR